MEVLFFVIFITVFLILARYFFMSLLLVSEISKANSYYKSP